MGANIAHRTNHQFRGSIRMMARPPLWKIELGDRSWPLPARHLCRLRYTVAACDYSNRSG
jgi:hypothetical protein